MHFHNLVKMQLTSHIKHSDRSLIALSILYYRMISEVLAILQIEGFDVKALRAFRVLRPLRLISGVPSLQIARQPRPHYVIFI